jgi:hypothetical protein
MNSSPSLQGRKRTASGTESLTSTPVMGPLTNAVVIPELSLTGSATARPAEMTEPSHPSCFSGAAPVSNDSCQQIPALIKSLVWKRYATGPSPDPKCYCCRSTALSPASFSCSLLVAAAGPKLDNIRPICPECAAAVGDSSLADFITKYGLHVGLDK